MATPAWFAGFFAAFAPTRRFESLFAKSDDELAIRGYDREGLTRSHIVGLGGF